ncbi:NADH-quinone oxidoreductase subunit C [bacterium]|nr:NADH-quinone oxidoreductase subunit C [bacterium]
MQFKEVAAILKEKHGDAIVSQDETRRDPFVVVKPASIVAVARTLRDDPRLRYDHLSLVSAVDYPKEKPPTIEVVYHVDSLSLNHPFVFKVRLPRESPKVPTLLNVWRTSDWHERESWDLMGVEFEGHPNLTRILCAEDWVGHPLRKDYKWPVEYHGVPCGPFAKEGVNIPPDWEQEGFTTRKE